MAAARACLDRAKPNEALTHLERAYVLAQRDFVPHWRVRVMLLRAACAAADARELRGQLIRLLWVPLGHLSGRLPRGNIGPPMPTPSRRWTYPAN
jgi:hypothetical protein